MKKLFCNKKNIFYFVVLLLKKKSLFKHLPKKILFQPLKVIGDGVVFAFEASSCGDFCTLLLLCTLLAFG
jgi:hypothetical protein